MFNDFDKNNEKEKMFHEEKKYFTSFQFLTILLQLKLHSYYSAFSRIGKRTLLRASTDRIVVVKM
jgi:hypothetical protein